MTRIVVAEPGTLVRELMAAVCEAAEGIEVIATVSDRAGLIAACQSFAADVVLTGPDLGDGDLRGVLADVMLTGTRVLVLCDAAESTEATTLLLAGASGCLYWQDCSLKEMVAAVKDVAAGHAALHPAAAAAVLAQWRTVRSIGPSSTSDTERSSTLTRREAEVLAALARGLPTKTIGRELSLSPKTIEAHIGRLLTKLDARNRAHAVALAQSRGLLPQAGTSAPPGTS